MDLAAFRAQFPALDRVTYLNTAVATPGARPVLAAMRRAHEEWESGDFSWQAWEREAYATRELFSRLINADPDSVALTSSVAYAASTVAACLPPGRVVVGAREFRSNYCPWVALRDRGVEVVEVLPTDEGVIPTRGLIDEIRDGTALLAVSEVQSSNGFRVHLREIVERARAHGTRVFVDLCQSAGALRFDAEEVGVDFAAAHGYKWLLGPRGAAWLYVRPDRVEELRPLTPSWKTVDDPYADYYGGPYEPPKTARKLDGPVEAWFAWPGAKAALDLLLALDGPAVERRCLELAATFREGARARGFAVVAEEAPSHIVGVVVEHPDDVRARLKQRRVVAAVRGGFLRFGFHAFNDESDVETALEALGEA